MTLNPSPLAISLFSSSIFWPFQAALGILAPQPGIKLAPLAVKVSQPLDHQGSPCNFVLF